MAATATLVSMQTSIVRAWSVIATDDADTDLVITPTGSGLSSTTPVVVILVPLLAAANISNWIISSALPLTAAGWTITKTTDANSGSATPQLMVYMFAPPFAQISHP